MTPFTAATGWFRSHRTLALCGSLGLVVTIAAATAGSPRFGGARWVPHWHVGAPAPATRTARLHPPRLRPPIAGGRGSDLHLGTVLAWVGVTVCVGAVVYLVARLVTGRRSRSAGRRPDVSGLAPSAADPEPEPDAPSIRRGIQQALQLLHEDRTPGDAVMLAWLGLEQSAEDSGIVRRPAETATELTSRIIRRVLTDDRAVATLLALYLRARFGDYEVTVADVTRAREALEGLVRSWDATSPSPPARFSGSTR